MNKKGKTHQELNLLLIEEGKYEVLSWLANEAVNESVIRTAIDLITDIHEMRQFLKELEELYEEIRQDGRGAETARENLGYMLYYYGKDTRHPWLDALPNVSHPFFGRTDPTPDEAFKHGVERGKQWRTNRNKGDGEPDSPF